MFDWNDLRYFLELARRGKLAAAALRLGVDHTTVARRVAALEEALGVPLFDRENRAYRLNENGRRLIGHAERIEAGSLQLMDDIAPVASGPVGTVRLATPEAFGSQFLARHCMSFHKSTPGVTLELIAETRTLNFSRRDADAAITLAPPGHGRVVSEKVGDYRLRLYAAPSYLQQHPPIVRLADLKPHHFLWYVDDLLPVPELQILDKALGDVQVIFRTTSVTGQANAAEAGLGIALLPCFVADRMKGLTPVLPGELSIMRDLWLVAHAELRHEPHVDRVCGFIKTLLASERRVLLGIN
ncbi:LysR family transcriptional regulator [Kordiimonas marina]|uniref:LysR family transcriptional regulator n=1 Tax=Kordiimonas marina TaxID=2872312 RepID=UPI001FF3595B|nr:LysR family transcriptional regulator [Kordiimonas marina]MCJ9429736.1 LysR family transcriptional regulator [Kordiimonas marina]